jgi:hypothetical protein
MYLGILLNLSQLSWAVRLYHLISCLTWGQQYKKKDITNWCHTSINRDILFFTKLIQSSSVNSFFPRKDRSKKAAMNDWVGHVFDTSVCVHKADHKAGLGLWIPDNSQWERLSQSVLCGAGISAPSHAQVQWEGAGVCHTAHASPRRAALKILRCFAGSQWVPFELHWRKWLYTSYC